MFHRFVSSPLAELSPLIAVCCLRQAPRSRQVGGLVLLLLDQVGGLVLLVALPLEHKQHPLVPGAAFPPTQGLEYLLAAPFLIKGATPPWAWVCGRSPAVPSRKVAPQK